MSGRFCRHPRHGVDNPLVQAALQIGGDFLCPGFWSLGAIRAVVGDIEVKVRDGVSARAPGGGGFRLVVAERTLRGPRGLCPVSFPLSAFTEEMAVHASCESLARLWLTDEIRDTLLSVDPYDRFRFQVHRGA